MNSQEQESTREERRDRFTSVSNSSDGSKLIYKAKFTPTTEDHGLYLGCRAEQFGLKNETLNVQKKVKIQAGLDLNNSFFNSSENRKAFRNQICTQTS